MPAPSAPLVGLVAASLVLSGLWGGSAVAAPLPSTCVLTPVVRADTVNQGVGAYAPLVRGKETLVRFYLSLPSCAAGTPATIALTGAGLSVTTGGALGTAIPSYRPSFPTSTPPQLAPYANAPALDAPADPLFVVPGASLVPSTTAAFTATFAATLTYLAKASSTAVGATRTANVTVTRSFDKKTGALRVLVVPMGDTAQSYASQFDSTAQSVTTNGLRALARMLPVPDVLGDLRPGSTGGVRYRIAPTLLNLQPLYGTDGKFCGRAGNFEKIKANLGQFLQSWNAANPTAPADRVLGVVKDTLAAGGSSGCAEGMAAVGGAQAWVRAVPDTVGTRTTPAKPSMTGALMAMEIGHTLGLVPPGRSDPYNAYHSPNKVADLESPGRAYNVTLRTFLSTNRTAMTLGDSWDNTTTVYEPADWRSLLCVLGGTDTTACAAPGSVGTFENVPAGKAFVLAGTTDGTAAGTDVLESYFAAVHRAPAVPDSAYRLLQLDGSGGVLRDDGVQANVVDSDHHTDGTVTTPADSVAAAKVGLSAAVPFNTDAERVELRRSAPDGSSVLLYARGRLTPPVLVPPDAVGPDALGNHSQDPARADSQPALSPNGRWLAWTKGNQVVLSPVPDRTAVTVVPVPGTAVGQAAWRADGSALAVVADGDLWTIGVSLAASPPTFGPPSLVLDLGVPVVQHPTWSPDGASIALSDGRSILTVPAGGGASEPLVEGNSVVVYSAPSWSRTPGDARLAFQSLPTGRITAVVVPTTTRRLNLGPGGAQTSGGPFAGANPSVSGTGRYVAFASLQSDLGPSDTNQAFDVYVRDVQTGTTELVSEDSAGTQGLRDSYRPSISDDGRFVAFYSYATLAPGDANGADPSVFVRDRVLGTTTIVAGQANGISVDPALDGSGQYVAFASTATNLVDGDTNALPDVFKVTLASGAVERVSVAADGTQANGESGLNAGIDISDGGGVVAFGSTATNLTAAADVDGTELDVFVRATGTTTLVSRASAAGDQGSGQDAFPSLSADGRYVAFRSASSNLVLADTNNALDVLVHDRDTGSTERVSVRNDGGQGTATVFDGRISRDGRSVVFDGQGQGGYVPGGSTAGNHVYVRDRIAGTTRQADLATDATLPNGLDSHAGGISGDGTAVVFQSDASNLVPIDTNGQPDVFVRGPDASAAPPPAPPTPSVVLRAADASLTPLAADASQPSFADDGTVLFARAGGVRRIGADGTGEVAVTPAGSGDASPTAAAGRYGFDRASGVDREVWVTAPTPATGTYTVQSPQPALVRVSLFYDCGDYRVPVAVALLPGQIDAARDSFLARLDPGLACAGGSLVALTSDGFTLVEQATVITATVTVPVTAPLASIYGRPADSTVLQFDSLGVAGTGRDAAGTLSDSALTWTLRGPATAVDSPGPQVRSGSGAQFDASAPAGGWVPGSYLLELRTTSALGGSGAQTGSASIALQMVADADHDGLSQAVEQALAAAGCAGSDADPTNAFGDCDGDGISNLDDLLTQGGPVTAATTYSATAVLSPDPYSAGSRLTAQVTLSANRAKDVTASTVRIARIAGKAVPASAGLTATSWRVRDGIGAAAFDGVAFTRWLRTEDLVGRTINVELSGSGSPRKGRSFTFTAVDALPISP